MDNELNDLKRRAGITEETYNTSAYEEYIKFINNEYEFLGKLAAIISRTMAPNNSRQVIGAIKQRRDGMEKLARDVQGTARDQKTDAYKDKQIDSKSYGTA